jgi:hypothetical protein
MPSMSEAQRAEWYARHPLTEMAKAGNSSTLAPVEVKLGVDPAAPSLPEPREQDGRP